MKTIRTYAALIAIAGVAYACGDDTGTGNGGGTSVADLAGNWTASQFEYTKVGSAGTSVDLVTLGGAAAVNLASDGSFTGTLRLPGSTTNIPFMGTIAINGSTLTLTVSDTVNAGLITLTPDDPIVFNSFTLSGNQLTLSSTTGIDFDFTLGMCGAPPCPEDDATLVIILNR